MASEQLLAAEGVCFYAGGGVFRARFYKNVFDENIGRDRKIMYSVDSDLTLDILRQGFELLVSEESKKLIGSTFVHCTRSEDAPPSVLLAIGSDTYELRLSARGTGAARLRVWLPASSQDTEIDAEEIEEMMGGSDDQASE